MAMGAVVLLAWTPRSLLEPGFQLSFAAVGGDLPHDAAAATAGTRAIRCPCRLVEVVGISAACGIVTAPILWLQFGTIPLWTVPANALAEPAMPVLLGCGLGAAVLAPVIPPAAVALSWIAGRRGSLDRVLGAPDRVAAVRADVVARTRSSRVAVADRRRRRRCGCCRPIAAARPSSRPSRSCRSPRLGWWALHPPPTWSPPAGLRVSFLDVGQGDGILLETPRGRDARRRGPARGARRPPAAAAWACTRSPRSSSRTPIATTSAARRPCCARWPSAP